VFLDFSLIGAAQTMIGAAQTMIGAAQTMIGAAQTMIGAAQTMTGAAQTMTGARQTSFTSNHQALTFTTSGISKTSALPKMKFAWLAVNGPDDLKREALTRLELIADTYLSMNAPIQLAAPVLLQARDAFQQQIRARVLQNLKELDSQLARQKHLSRLEVEGGWYAVLRVPATRSDEDLALELLEQHDVYVHPGHFYDFPAEGYLVVSLITLEEEFAAGVRLISQAFF